MHLGPTAIDLGLLGRDPHCLFPTDVPTDARARKAYCCSVGLGLKQTWQYERTGSEVL